MCSCANWRYRHLTGAPIGAIGPKGLMYEGRFCTYGCSHLSTNCDIFSVMFSQLETMGLFPIGVLCIFFRKYNLDVLWFAVFVPVF